MELVIKNFIEIDKKRKRNKSADRNQNNSRNMSEFIISSLLINLKINGEMPEDEQKESEEEETVQSGEGTEDKKKIIASGGYGAVGKHYGISPVVQYTDYSKIWGHLGSFKSQGMYENINKNFSELMSQSQAEGSRGLVSFETLEKAEKHLKYFVMGDMVGDFGYVPPVGIGISSKEWEKYRLMTQMSIYRPLLNLMRSVV